MESILKRDRQIILAALIGTTVLSWWYMAYEARAMAPFTSVRNGKPVSLSYHAVPPEALEDPQDLLALARLGLAAALAAPMRRQR